jgi:hypothetical protein
MQASGVSSLTASIACTLLRNESSRVDVLISWWIALKFEEVEPPELGDLLRDYRVNISFESARETEGRILYSIGFSVPYHTVVRQMQDAPSSLSRVELDTWCYVLMYSNMQAMRSAEEWLRIAESSGGNDVLLGIALELCPDRMKHGLVEAATPKTVSVRRKRSLL